MADNENGNNEAGESRAVAVQNKKTDPIGTTAVQAFIPADFPSTYRFAELIHHSGLAPKGFQRPESIAVAIFMGYELGLSPMVALRSVAVVNGRPTLWGDSALGLIRARGVLEDINEFYEGEWPNDNFTAICEVTRKGSKRARRSEFSIADAKKANLFNKEGPWSQYPKRMLKMRARGFALRDEFGDVLGGLHLQEEIEADEFEVSERGMESRDPPSPDPDPKAGAAATREPAPAAEPKRRGRPPKAASEAAQKNEPVEEGKVIEGEVVDDSPPDPGADAPATAKAETSKAEPETATDATKAATPADRQPSIAPIAEVVPGYDKFDAKFQAYLVQTHAEFQRQPNMDKLKSAWQKFYNDWAPSFDPAIKDAHDAALKKVRDFHKTRLDAPPAQQREVIDFAPFKAELDKLLGKENSDNGVKAVYADFTEVPIRQGYFSASQKEQIEALLQEHLKRVDF